MYSNDQTLLQKNKQPEIFSMNYNYKKLKYDINENDSDSKDDDIFNLKKIKYNNKDF